MSERMMVSMESLIKSISMGPFGSDVKVEYMKDTGVPIIDGSNLTSIKMNMNSYRYLDEDKAKKLDAALAHKGDIIVTHRGTLGQLSYVPEDCPFDEVLISQSQFRVTLDTSQVNPVYFAYYFHTVEGQKRLLSFANYVGVPALACATTNFRKLSFPLIPLEEQNRIATLLEKIDLSIANNNAIISELEAMAKDIYDYWFVQFDFPDENGRPYKSSGGRMVWNEDLNREIPDGWKPTRFGDLVTVKRGISYSASNLVDAGLPMINLNSFTPSATYKTSGIKYYKGEVKDGGQVNAYDLLMCTTQQTDIDGKTDIIGKTMLIPDLFDSQMVYSMDLVRIQTDELLKTVIVSETKTPWYNKYITGFATGTSILHLKLDGFLSYQIPLPKGTAILKHFNSLYMELERRKSIAMKENEELTSLRDWLLPMLMNGQVKVGGVA